MRLQIALCVPGRCALFGAGLILSFAMAAAASLASPQAGPAKENPAGPLPLTSQATKAQQPPAPARPQTPQQLAFGDGQLLQACFAGQLEHVPGEERINARQAPSLLWIERPAQLKPLATLPPLPPQLRGSIRRVDVGQRKVVALTFDFCERQNEVAGYDGRVIDILRRHKVKATLYMGGKWMATHPERTKQLIADPLFELGNHGWTHGNMRVLRGQELRQQILYTQAQYELLRKELESAPCFRQLQQRRQVPIRLQKALYTLRFPYGTCGAHTLKLTAQLGLPAIQWDIVTADPWKGQTVQGILRAVRRARPGSIIIMHANGRGWKTAQALPRIIKELRQRGYVFVTVSELLRMGRPVAAKTCYETRPGDNFHYDRIFGKGTVARKAPRRVRTKKSPAKVRPRPRPRQPS